MIQKEDRKEMHLSVFACKAPLPMEFQRIHPEASLLAFGTGHPTIQMFTASQYVSCNTGDRRERIGASIPPTYVFPLGIPGEDVGMTFLEVFPDDGDERILSARPRKDEAMVTRSIAPSTHTRFLPMIGSLDIARVAGRRACSFV